MQPASNLDARALLRLMWLASPALPVGGFSYSEVLESAVDAGLVGNENQARAWLIDQLDLALARADLAVVAQAFEAWCTLHDEPEDGDADAAASPSERVVVIEKSPEGASSNPARQTALSARIGALNSWVHTTRESSELRQQTEQMGRSLLDWLRTQDVARVATAGGEITDPRLAVLAALRPAPTWPVAHALALALTGAPQREALLAHGFGWAENMVQAALKTVPLGQSAGQRILAVLVDALPAAVDAALALGDEDRQAHTPMLAILSARHEAQYSRLFRS